MENIHQMVWWVLSGALGVLAIIIRYTVTRLISKLDQLVKVVETLTSQNAVLETLIKTHGETSADHEKRIRSIEHKQAGCKNFKP